MFTELDSTADHHLKDVADSEYFTDDLVVA
jgi:hypothetical protein